MQQLLDLVVSVGLYPQLMSLITLMVLTGMYAGIQLLQLPVMVLGLVLLGR
jgi:hypothetical protein